MASIHINGYERKKGFKVSIFYSGGEGITAFIEDDAMNELLRNEKANAKVHVEDAVIKSGLGKSIKNPQKIGAKL